MGILTPAFLGRFPDRVLNLHPSLLPAFPGAHAIERRARPGVACTGVTVHLVDEVRRRRPDRRCRRPCRSTYDEPPEALRARMHEVEHRLLPEAVGCSPPGAPRSSDGGRVASEGAG